MKEKIINNILNFLKLYHKYTKKEEEKLKYGLESIYITITKLFVIIILTTILGITKEVIFIILAFNLIRYFGFGFHANKSMECLFCSILFFVILPEIFLNISFSKISSLILCIFCIINYIIFAPADTYKRPLTNKRKRIIRKWLTVLVGTIYSLIIMFSNNITVNSILQCSLFIQMLIINPLLYKLFKQPYNNYKNLN